MAVKPLQMPNLSELPDPSKDMFGGLTDPSTLMDMSNSANDLMNPKLSFAPDTKLSAQAQQTIQQAAQKQQEVAARTARMAQDLMRQRQAVLDEQNKAAQAQIKENERLIKEVQKAQQKVLDEKAKQQGGRVGAAPDGSFVLQREAENLLKDQGWNNIVSNLARNDEMEMWLKKAEASLREKGVSDEAVIKAELDVARNIISTHTKAYEREMRSDWIDPADGGSAVGKAMRNVYRGTGIMFGASDKWAKEEQQDINSINRTYSNLMLLDMANYQHKRAKTKAKNPDEGVIESFFTAIRDMWQTDSILAHIVDTSGYLPIAVLGTAAGAKVAAAAGTASGASTVAAAATAKASAVSPLAGKLVGMMLSADAVAAGAVTGALAATDAAGGAYDSVMYTKVEDIEKNYINRYGKHNWDTLLAAHGGDVEKAKSTLATQAARDAGLTAFATTAPLGVFGVEAAIAKIGTQGLAAHAGKRLLTVGANTLSETLEEGFTQFSQNVGARPATGVSLKDDVGAMAGMGAVAGGGMAAAAQVVGAMADAHSTHTQPRTDLTVLDPTNWVSAGNVNYDGFRNVVGQVMDTIAQDGRRVRRAEDDIHQQQQRVFDLYVDEQEVWNRLTDDQRTEFKDYLNLSYNINTNDYAQYEETAEMAAWRSQDPAQITAAIRQDNANIDLLHAYRVRNGVELDQVPQTVVPRATALADVLDALAAEDPNVNTRQREEQTINIFNSRVQSDTTLTNTQKRAITLFTMNFADAGSRRMTNAQQQQFNAQQAALNPTPAQPTQQVNPNGTQQQTNPNQPAGQSSAGTNAAPIPNQSPTTGATNQQAPAAPSPVGTAQPAGQGRPTTQVTGNGTVQQAPNTSNQAGNPAPNSVSPNPSNAGSGQAQQTGGTQSTQTPTGNSGQAAQSGAAAPATSNGQPVGQTQPSPTQAAAGGRSDGTAPTERSANGTSQPTIAQKNVATDNAFLADPANEAYVKSTIMVVFNDLGVHGNGWTEDKAILRKLLNLRNADGERRLDDASIDKLYRLLNMGYNERAILVNRAYRQTDPVRKAHNAIRAVHGNVLATIERDRKEEQRNLEADARRAIEHERQLVRGEEKSAQNAVRNVEREAKAQQQAFLKLNDQYAKEYALAEQAVATVRDQEQVIRNAEKDAADRKARSDQVKQELKRNLAEAKEAREELDLERKPLKEVKDELARINRKHAAGKTLTTNEATKLSYYPAEVDAMQQRVADKIAQLNALSAERSALIDEQKKLDGDSTSESASRKLGSLWAARNKITQEKLTLLTAKKNAARAIKKALTTHKKLNTFFDTPSAEPTFDMRSVPEQVTQPIEQVTQPTEQVAQPTEQVAQPTEQVTQPIEQVAQPTPRQTTEPDVIDLAPLGINAQSLPFSHQESGVSGRSQLIAWRRNVIALVNIDGVLVPFYRNTGLQSKQNVQATRWNPFFGISPSEFFNVARGELGVNNYYGSDILRQTAQMLDESISNDLLNQARNEASIDSFANNVATLEQINGLFPTAPVDMDKTGAINTVLANAAYVVDLLEQNKTQHTEQVTQPVPEQTAEPTVEQVTQPTPEQTTEPAPEQTTESVVEQVAQPTEQVTQPTEQVTGGTTFNLQEILSGVTNKRFRKGERPPTLNELAPEDDNAARPTIELTLEGKTYRGKLYRYRKNNRRYIAFVHNGNAYGMKGVENQDWINFGAGIGTKRVDSINEQTVVQIKVLPDTAIGENVAGQEQDRTVRSRGDATLTTKILSQIPTKVSKGKPKKDNTQKTDIVRNPTKDGVRADGKNAVIKLIPTDVKVIQPSSKENARVIERDSVRANTKTDRVVVNKQHAKLATVDDGLLDYIGWMLGEHAELEVSPHDPNLRAEAQLDPKTIGLTDDGVTQYSVNMTIADYGLGAFMDVAVYAYTPTTRMFKRLGGVSNKHGIRVRPTEEQTAGLEAYLQGVAQRLNQVALDNQTGPFNPNRTGQLVKSASVPMELAQVVQTFASELGIPNMNLAIATKEDVFTGAFQRFMTPHPQDLVNLLHNRRLNGAFTVPLYGNPDIRVIIYDSTVSTEAQIELVVHELGHIMEQKLLAESSKETQQAVLAAYDKWYQSKISADQNHKKSEVLFLSHLANLRAANGAERSLANMDGTTLQLRDVENYWVSFAEWWADQTARWATTDKKPLTRVERFFKGISKRFNAAVKRVKSLFSKKFGGTYDFNADKVVADFYNTRLDNNNIQSVFEIIEAPSSGASTAQIVDELQSRDPVQPELDFTTLEQEQENEMQQTGGVANGDTLTDTRAEDENGTDPMGGDGTTDGQPREVSGQGGQGDGAGAQTSGLETTNRPMGREESQNDASQNQTDGNVTQTYPERLTRQERNALAEVAQFENVPVEEVHRAIVDGNLSFFTGTGVAHGADTQTMARELVNQEVADNPAQAMDLINRLSTPPADTIQTSGAATVTEYLSTNPADKAELDNYLQAERNRISAQVDQALDEQANFAADGNFTQAEQAYERAVTQQQALRDIPASATQLVEEHTVDGVLLPDEQTKRSLPQRIKDIITKVLSSIRNTVAAVSLAIALATGSSLVMSTDAMAATPTEQAVVQHIVQTNDHQGKPIIVADKQAGTLTVYNAAGTEQASTPALFGKNVGDSITAKNTTPSGRFDLTRATNVSNRAYGNSAQVLTVNGKMQENNAGNLAIHRVMTQYPHENRVGRLDSPTAEDNRISLGCINVPVDFYNTHLDKDTDAVVYVLPETDAGRTGIFADISPAMDIASRASAVIPAEVIEQALTEYTDLTQAPAKALAPITIQGTNTTGQVAYVAPIVVGGVSVDQINVPFGTHTPAEMQANGVFDTEPVSKDLRTDNGTGVNIYEVAAALLGGLAISGKVRATRARKLASKQAQNNAAQNSVNANHNNIANPQASHVPQNVQAPPQMTPVAVAVNRALWLQYLQDSHLTAEKDASGQLVESGVIYDAFTHHMLNFEAAMDDIMSDATYEQAVNGTFDNPLKWRGDITDKTRSGIVSKFMNLVAGVTPTFDNLMTEHNIARVGHEMDSSIPSKHLAQVKAKASGAYAQIHRLYIKPLTTKVDDAAIDMRMASKELETDIGRVATVKHVLEEAADAMWYGREREIQERVLQFDAVNRAIASTKTGRMVRASYVAKSMLLQKEIQNLRAELTAIQGVYYGSHANDGKTKLPGGYTQALAQQTLADLQTKYGNSFTTVEALAGDLTHTIQGIRNFAAAAGVFDNADLTVFKELGFDNYVPLYAEQTDPFAVDESDAYTKKSLLDNALTDIPVPQAKALGLTKDLSRYHREGALTPAADAFTNMKVFSMNMAGRIGSHGWVTTVEQLYEGTVGRPISAARITDETELAELNADHASGKLPGLIRVRPGMEQFVGIDQSKVKPIVGKGTNSHGERVAYHYYFTDPAIQNEIYSNMNLEESILLKSLRNVSSLTRLAARMMTAYKPVWSVYNYARDSLERSSIMLLRPVKGRDGKLVPKWTLAKNYFRNLALIASSPALQSELYRYAATGEIRTKHQRILHEAVGEGAIVLMTSQTDKHSVMADLNKSTVDRMASQIGDMLGAGFNKSGLGKVKQSAQQLHEFYIMRLVELPQITTALSAYMAYQEAGVNKGETANRVRDQYDPVRVNNKVINTVAQTNPFVRSTFSGHYNLWRTLTEYWKPGTWQAPLAYLTVGTMATVAVLSMMAGLFGDDEDGVPKLARLSSGALMGGVPVPLEDGSVWTVPVGFGLNKLIWGVGANLWRQEMGMQNSEETMRNLVTLATDNTSPVSMGSTKVMAENPEIGLALLTTPLLAKPLMEIATNTKSYGGGKIITRETPLDQYDSDQDNFNVPEAYKTWAKFLRRTAGVDMRPETIRHLMESYAYGPTGAIPKALLQDSDDKSIGNRQRKGEVFGPFLTAIGADMAIQPNALDYAQHTYAMRTLRMQLHKRYGVGQTHDEATYEQYADRGARGGIVKRADVATERAMRDKGVPESVITYVVNGMRYDVAREAANKKYTRLAKEYYDMRQKGEDDPVKRAAVQAAWDEMELLTYNYVKENNRVYFELLQQQ